MIENLTDNYLVRVSEGGLEAYLTILKSEEKIQLIDIQKNLLKYKISYGVEIETVKNIIKNQLFDQEFLIARGKQAGKSKPAYLEYLISEKIESTPHVDEDDNADFKDINIVKLVEKNTGLIRKHPIVVGNEGLNVFNEILPAEEADDVNIVLGVNTNISDTDEYLCVASCDGYLIKNSNGSFSVRPLLKIKDDVDFSTGNIDFKGSVIINGNVKTGFSVKASQDITINGVIEDAIVQAGGTVRCEKGIIGRKQGKIIADENVRIGYIENQTVISKGNIYVKSEAINSELEAGNSIYSERGKIIGGSITAGNLVDIGEIGNKEGTSTEVSVGVKTYILDRISRIKTEISEFENTEKKITEEIMKFAMKKVDGKGFTEEMEEELVNLKKEKELVAGRIIEHKNNITEAEYDMVSVIHAKIIVRNKLYSNVKCLIYNKAAVTKEEYTNVKVLLEDDQIKFERG
jgi:uncharacterized protein